MLMIMLTLQMHGQANSQSPCGPVPSENQLRWQDMEMYIPTRNGALAMRIQSFSILQTLTADSGRVFANRLACVASFLQLSITAVSACGHLSIQSIA